MNKFKEIFDYYFNIICTLLLIFMISGICFLIYKDVIKKENAKTNNNSQLSFKDNSKIEDLSNENIINKIKVDIKGSVKRPAVYEIENNKNVSDLIEMAGGLTKNATTDNINLSRKLEDQMVIRISNKSELKKKDTPLISECVCNEVEIKKCEENAITKINGENVNTIITNQEESKYDNSNIKKEDSSVETSTNLISLNNASKEQLMTLTGVGESKALAIIEYREKNNGFKNIEEIKNVSGIGDALFEKIKDNITI